MKTTAIVLSFFTLLSFLPTTHAKEVQPLLTCSKTVIDTVYIPKLREVADWTDDQLRPYAKQMCNLEKQQGALRGSIKNRAEEIRTGNWRICKEVIPGNPNPTDAECKTAYAEKVNDLIDKCIELVSLGHNPHNVLLFIDPLKVEVACLKGVNTALK
ncbi:hypothetical protein [uncultured Bdellovibrio sp.]|uniref:hypothetical protein n=1 Tax=Bdellovibrio sp. HCB-162 TaxID=3394234 RepID=UPI0025DE1B0A|nr:hypothetical protein [uncultured Bdellovibrio sp.]